MIAKHLRNYLLSSDRLYYLFNFFYRFPQKEYFANANLAKLRKGVNRRFHFKTYGDMNPELPLYLIKIDDTFGFMAFYYYTAKLLAVADLFGFTPVIEWKSLSYQKDNPDIGGDNIFEYFFETPCGISTADAMQSRHVAIAEEYSHDIFPQTEFGNYVPSNERDALYARAVNKFLKLNAATQSYISERISSILEGKKTLGIHVRGGAYKEKVLHHPVAIEPEEHIAEAKKAISAYGFERIFLATDEEEVVAKFKDAFGDMVVSYDDVSRAKPEDHMEAGLFALRDRGLRLDNGYFTGLEVLTDVYTLAACQGLIAGVSNVAVSAVYANGDQYEYKQFIYKGTYGYDVPGGVSWKKTKANKQLEKLMKSQKKK